MSSSLTRFVTTLLREISEINKKEYFFDEGLATIEFNRSDLRKIIIVLCPQTGFFRKTMCKFELGVEEGYPSKKPTIKSLSKIFHPNVSSSGSVCFSMFGNDWKSSYRIIDYVEGLLFFLNHPNHNSPLESKCVKKNEVTYDELVRRACKGAEISGTKYDRVTIGGINLKNSMELKEKMKMIELNNKESMK